MEHGWSRDPTSLMLTSPVLNTSRSLSPTRSMIAWKSSFAAMPCWMLLMTASSAFALLGFLEQALRLGEQLARSRARCPCRRAMVVSRRISDSPNASARSKLSIWMVPSARSEPTIGMIAAESELSRAGHDGWSCRRVMTWGLRVFSAVSVSPPGRELRAGRVNRTPCS